MSFYLMRNGQQLGPYPEERVREYVAQGSMKLTDLARTDAQTTWQPLNALLSTPLFPNATGYAAMPYPSGAGAPVNFPPDSPPSLHWALVLLLSMVSGGIFAYVWVFIQANWVKKLNGSGRPTLLFVLWLAGAIVGYALLLSAMAAGDAGAGLAMLGSLLIVGSAVIFYVAIFQLRRTLIDFYQSAPPVGLRISALWTFLFSILCLQNALSSVAVYRQIGQMPV